MNVKNNYLDVLCTFNTGRFKKTKTAVLLWIKSFVYKETLEMNYHLNKVDSCENSTHRLEHIVR